MVKNTPHTKTPTPMHYGGGKQKQNKHKFLIFLIVVTIILIPVVLISLFHGVTDWPYNTQSRLILFQIRLPRVVLACLVGTALALSGAIFQGLLGNPLADPFLLGTSSAGALGAVLVLVMGLSYLVTPVSFSFSLISIFVVYNLARTGWRTSVRSLILAGVIVSTFCSAIVLLLLVLAKQGAHQIFFWLMGGLNMSGWEEIWIPGIIILICSAILLCYSRDLNIISCGEYQAQYLGINIERVKKVLLILSSLLVACAVSVSGMIGFVGLIVPHIVRDILGPDHRRLLPASCLTGFLLLALTDFIARTVISPREIPVGAITAIIGGPFFLLIMNRKK